MYVNIIQQYADQFQISVPIKPLSRAPLISRPVCQAAYWTWPLECIAGISHLTGLRLSSSGAARNQLPLHPSPMSVNAISILSVILFFLLRLYLFI